MTPKAPKYETIKQFLIHGISSRTFTDAIPSENQLGGKIRGEPDDGQKGAG